MNQQSIITDIYFSIIIPTFNSTGLFERSLISVLKQTCKNYELIIVDDSNNNDIKDLIQKKYSLSNLFYYKNIPSKGAVDNWNYGISLAKGKYCILMHHDESFGSEDVLAETYEVTKTYDCIVFNKLVYKGNSILKFNLKASWIDFILKNIPSFIYVINFVGPTACIVIKNNNIPKFDINLRWLVDVDWYYKIFKSNKPCYKENIFIHSHFGHKHQISMNLDIKNQEKSDLLYLKHRTSLFSHLQILYLIRYFHFIIKFIFKIKLTNIIYMQK